MSMTNTNLGPTNLVLNLGLTNNFPLPIADDLVGIIINDLVHILPVVLQVVKEPY